MITLAIDTSQYVAVGLAVDGAPGPSAVVTDARAHVEQVTPCIARVCADAGVRLADVDQLVVGMGPGPYTGLRVGIATALTLAAVDDTPVHRVCSLDAIALGAPGEGELLVASDARRKELFWARYLDGVRVGEPQVGAPSALPELPVFGTIPAALREGLHIADEITLAPELLAARGLSLPEAGPEPYYLRAADATVPGAPKSALPRLKLPAGGPRR